jgi:hypothetical protein
MDVQPDGAILKVESTEPAKTAEEAIDKDLDEANKYLSRARRSMAGEETEEDKKLNDQTFEKAEKIEKEKEDAEKKKAEKKTQVEPKAKEEAIQAVAKEIKLVGESQKEVAAAPVGEVKSHETARAASKLPEHVALQSESFAEPGQDAESDASAESWKSAFFFFASLVLFVVLAIAVISFFYFNREQAQKTGGGPESVSLKANPAKAGGSQAAYLNDSSSTSDSGEKIAMLFDRVRQSLEDLSDKTPTGQADVAGGSRGTQGQI